MSDVFAQITPHAKEAGLGAAIGVAELYLKREDLHPLGSHKGRSIPVMIDHYVALGENRFSISSSGNAAIAAAMHVTALNAAGRRISLDIFVGNGIDAEKLAILTQYQSELITLHKTDRPKQAALQQSQTGARSLRQSNDDVALKGYAALAEELLLIPHLRAVFVPASSATTAQALLDYFLAADKKVEVHIVQTTTCHPIAADFTQNTPAIAEEPSSLADAIVDKVALRKTRVAESLKARGGYGWIADNDYIARAQTALKDRANVIATGNGALTLAGLMLAAKTGRTWNGAVACIISGK